MTVEEYRDRLAELAESGCEYGYQTIIAIHEQNPIAGNAECFTIRRCDAFTAFGLVYSLQKDLEEELR
jgi:hypothetical protein